MQQIKGKTHTRESEYARDARRENHLFCND